MSNQLQTYAEAQHWRLNFRSESEEAYLVQEIHQEGPTVLQFSISQLPELASSLLNLHQAETGNGPAERAAPRPPSVPSMIREVHVDLAGGELHLCQPGLSGNGTDDANIYVSPDQVELLCAQLRAARDAVWLKRSEKSPQHPDSQPAEPVCPR